MPRSNAGPRPFNRDDEVVEIGRRYRHRVGATRSALLLVGLACAFGLFWATAAGATTVRVQPGQNLSQIARTYGTSVSALTAANGISNPNLVVIGTPLTIPTGQATVTSPVSEDGTTTVVAASGDSLWTIATRNGITMNALAQANGLSLSSTILIGMKLTIPAHSAPATATGALIPLQMQTYPAALLANSSRLTLLPLFQKWSTYFGVPASLVEGTCWWESGWQMGVVSSTGAVGIGQLEPVTVATLRTELGDQSLSATDASDNIEMAADYLHQLLEETGGSESQALAGYYQGLVSVRQNGMLPSTVQYVQGILATSALFD